MIALHIVQILYRYIYETLKKEYLSVVYYSFSLFY